MFTEVTLAPEIEDFLRGLTVPVRVLDGGAGQLNPSPRWAAAHLQPHNCPRSECTNEGLTIVSWGSDHDAGAHDAGEFAYVAYLSGDAYSDGTRRAVSREFVNDRIRNEQSYMPPVAGGDPTLARMDVDRRIVWFNFSLAPRAQGGLDLDGVDLYKILGEPIMRVLGADRLPRTTERARDLFLENAARANQGSITRLERSITDQRSSITSYADCIRTGYAEIRRMESELAVQRRVTTVCRARLEERWEALVAHPKLTRIADDGSTLVLTTTPLDIENPNTGETRYLGIINISLHHGSSLRLTLTNVDNAPRPNDESDTWAHPHCPQSCIPCWGGSEGLAGELLASHDLPAILEFTLQFLQSYNPNDSWGSSHAHMWGFGDEVEDEDEPECECSDCVRDREAA